MNIKKLSCLVLTLILCLAGTSCKKSDESAIEYIAKQAAVSLRFDGDLTNSGTAETEIKSYGSLAYKDKGILNQALSFKDGYLEFSNSTALAFDDSFSVSMWIKGNDVDACVDPILFGKASNSDELTEGPLSIRFYDGYTYIKTDLTFKYEDNSYKSYSFHSDNAFSRADIANSWNNITVVFDKDTVLYYLNGEILNQEKLPVEYQGYSKLATNDKPYFIGRAPIGNYNGYIDEFKFYNFAITKEDAMLIFKEGMQQHTNLLTVTVDSDEYTLNDKKGKMKAKVLYEPESECSLVPAKDVISVMGGTYTFDKDDANGRIDIDYNGKKYSLWVMDTNAAADKTHIKLDAYPLVNDDNVVLIPITFISKQLDANLKFDSEKKIYSIQY